MARFFWDDPEYDALQNPEAQIRLAMPSGNLSDKDRIKRATPDRHFERTWPHVLHAPVLMGWNGHGH